ncbi:MAG: hypothetical protein PCALPYG88_5498 [uncultured Paraburkholderia sp.]|nr:MAG: hypothetical protein PCALPYG08_5644 [uncultured Paraburkholderia sp.]CAH2935510.1 MAG: hypothetical protein PCALPYG88_5498 [uncultured Paraburkholderia sp.]
MSDAADLPLFDRNLARHCVVSARRCRRYAPAASPERHSYAQCRCKEQANMRRRDAGGKHSVESKLRRCALKHVADGLPPADSKSATPSQRSSCGTLSHQSRARFWHAQSAASHHRSAGLHRNASRARFADDPRNAARSPVRRGARAHRMRLAQPLHLVPPSDQRGSAASATRHLPQYQVRTTASPEFSHRLGSRDAVFISGAALPMTAWRRPMPSTLRKPRS